jgi:hypothetical protein
VDTHHDQPQDTSFSLGHLVCRNCATAFELLHSLHDHCCTIAVANEDDIFAVAESCLKQASHSVGVCNPLDVSNIFAYRGQIDSIDTLVADITELGFDFVIDASSMEGSRYRINAGLAVAARELPMAEQRVRIWTKERIEAMVTACWEEQNESIVSVCTPPSCKPTPLR